jgi:hypothetical protein
MSAPTLEKATGEAECPARLCVPSRAARISLQAVSLGAQRPCPRQPRRSPLPARSLGWDGARAERLIREGDVQRTTENDHFAFDLALQERSGQELERLRWP